MKTEITYSNILWIGPQFTIILFMFWLGLIMLPDELRVIFYNTHVHGDVDVSIASEDFMLFLAFSLFLIGYGLHMLWGLSIRWCTVVLSDEGFTYVKPLRLSKKTIPWNSILGFSTSQMCQYRDISGQSALWCSDSIEIGRAHV